MLHETLKEIDAGTEWDWASTVRRSVGVSICILR